MASQQLSHVLQQLRRIYLLKEEANLNDGELLKRFFQQGDESTFEVLVQRYGPMVLGVCQRLLRNLHDAEDAFQTVFLVLVHKGRRLVGQEVIGNWLYRVAYNAALKARATAVQRRSKEPLAQVKPNEERDRVDRWNELRPLLDEELNKLSDKLREAIVLCDVLGRSRKEVAAQLGVPEGTLSWRLTRGRRRLAECLNRRGITLCGGAAMAVFSRNAVLAHVPAPLVNATVKAATAVAAGHAAAAGVISARVAALTEGVLKTMFVTKLKSIGAALLVLCIFGAGLGTLWPAAQGARTNRQIAPVVTGDSGISLRAQQDKKDPAMPPPEVIQAWQDAGARLEWVQTSELGMPIREFDPEQRGPGTFPIFEFSEPVGDLAKLPDAGMPFGVWFFGGATDAHLKEISGAKLKNLQFLLIKSQVGLTNAGLKELAALKNLQSLVLLQLEKKGLTDEASKELAMLKSLHSLYVVGPWVSDKCLKELAGLNSLRYLAVVNGLEGVTEAGLKELPRLKGLQALSIILSKQNITDAALKALAGMSNLELLNFHQCEAITDVALKQITGMTNLKCLGLGGTKVTDAGLKDLTALKNLRSLYLYDTEVTDGGLKQLAGLKLHVLDIPKTAKTDVGLQHSIAVLEPATKLSLKTGDEGWKITDAGLKELGRLKNLQWLDLDGTDISDAGLKDLAKLKDLQTLSLRNTQITDAVLKRLAGMKKLHALTLDGTQVTDSGLKELSGLKSLQRLSLNDTQATDAGMKELAGLTSLKNLNLGKTQVSDVGLKQLEGLKSLRDLDPRGTQVTDVGIVQLSQALPGLRIRKEE